MWVVWVKFSGHGKSVADSGVFGCNQGKGREAFANFAAHEGYTEFCGSNLRPAYSVNGGPIGVAYIGECLDYAMASFAAACIKGTAIAGCEVFSELVQD